MLKKNRRKSLAVLVASISVVSGEISANTWEEIIVTAQKREQNLQDVSVAVTAFSGDMVRDMNFINSVDIAAQTPGLNIGTPVGEGNNPSITLRGVGLNDFNDNNEGPIAVYRDGVYQSAMPGLTFQLFDLERVEVLRGPQGTLYGRNATGGLIHFISAKPTVDLEGYADVTLAQYNQVKTEGAISGPVTDGIQARLSLATNNHDGYVDNRIGADSNEANSYAARFQINFDISNNLSALVNVHAGESDTNAPQYQHQATGDVTGTDPTVDFYGYRDNDGDNFSGAYNREGVLNIETSGASVTAKWLGESMELVSITAIEQVEKLHQEDTDMGPVTGIVPQFASDIDQFSQELRLSGTADKLQWLVGYYYFDNEVVGALDLTANFPGPVVDVLTGSPAGAFGPSSVRFFSYDVDYTQDTQSSSVFSQLEYQLLDAFTLNIGLRYTEEERSMNYQNRADSSPADVVNSCLIMPGDPCGFGLGPAFPGTNTFLDFSDANPLVGDLNTINTDNVSGKIGLDYKPNDDMLVFVNFANGFKSGGFNGGFLDFTDGVQLSDVPFDEEILNSYELGVKTRFELPGGVIRFNATAFYYDYNDYQALTFANVSQFISNSDAEVTGLDLELAWLFGDKLEVSLGASLLDTEVDSVVTRGTPPTVTSGTKMVLAPDYSLNGIVRYRATDALLVQVDFSHQGEHFFDITNSDLSKENAYTVLNASVGYDLTDQWRISTFVKNLTNEEYRVYTFDFSGPAGFNQQFFAPPRWAGASVNYSF